MNPDRIKEELKLLIEIVKFMFLVLLVIGGGMTTFYYTNETNKHYHELLNLGWLFIGVISIGVVALFLYIYTLLRQIK